MAEFLIIDKQELEDIKSRMAKISESFSLLLKKLGTNENEFALDTEYISKIKQDIESIKQELTTQATSLKLSQSKIADHEARIATLEISSVTKTASGDTIL